MESELRPGRDLDAKVAENVLGCRVKWRRTPSSVESRQAPFCGCRGREHADYDERGIDGELCFYSTEIAVAWPIAQERDWIIQGNRVYLNDRDFEDGIAFRGETVAHAICLAALKAEGLEVSNVSSTDFFKSDYTLVVMPNEGEPVYDKVTRTLYVPPGLATAARVTLSSPDFLGDMRQLAEFVGHQVAAGDEQYLNEHNAARREEWSWYFDEGAAATPIDYDTALEIWQAASNGFSSGFAGGLGDNEPMMVRLIIEEWEKRRAAGHLNENEPS